MSIKKDDMSKPAIIQGWVYMYDRKKGLGIIQDTDEINYYIQKGNHPAIPNLASGMRVIFCTKHHPGFDNELEAYDVQLDPDPPFYKPRRKQSNQNTSKIPSDVQIAAQEALRLKRERREGLVNQPVETMPPGTRVYHPYYGTGVVVLAAKDILSVRFEKGAQKVIDIDRTKVMVSLTKTPKQTPAEKQLEQVVHKPSPPIIPIPQLGMLSDYIRSMASEVQIVLTDEGIEGENIYRYDPPSVPASAPQAMSLDSRVADAFQSSQKITKFYSHQITARQALLKGVNIVISTPTASGKTEAYNPTVFEELLNHPETTALYLFPLVALGIDQTERLERLNSALPVSEQIRIGIYNSSIPQTTKSEVLRANNRILVTTPDSLHYIILPKAYANWRNYFRNLRYVVIDEAHVYKGVLGANMANIIRRLLVRCRREGNRQFPQIIISSATVLNPSKLAEQLTGLPGEGFAVITESGAPIPGRHFLVTRSDIHDLEATCADLLEIKTKDSDSNGKHLVSTIVFLRSINEVKQATRKLRHHLRQTGNSDLVNLVEEYYSDKGDKNDVLIRLRKGEVRCIFTTTALMAGIDIGALDVAIVKHFPGLVLDARQMFGRAGRVGEGAVIFMASRYDPFDQFYFERPERLFTGPIEDVVANSENPILLTAHLKCAAQTIAEYNREGPLSGEWVDLFGPMGRDILQSLLSQHSLKIKGGCYYLVSSEDPHELEPLRELRAIGSDTYSLRNIVDGQQLEHKREATAFRDAHPGAILWVNSKSYKVIEFDLETRNIICQPTTSDDLRTSAQEELDIKILSIDSIDNKGKPLDHSVTIQHGSIKIVINVSSYIIYKNHPVMQCRRRSCRYETPVLTTRRCPNCGSPVRAKLVEEVLEVMDIPQPPVLQRELQTRACWINISGEVRDKFNTEFWPRWTRDTDAEQGFGKTDPDFEAAIHSIEHAILKAFPEYIICDKDEIGGKFQIDVNGICARLYIFDNFPGGLGLSDEFVHEYPQVLEGALQLIESCTCLDEQGCPVCLSYFGCNNYNQSLSKLAGRYLLHILMGKDPKKVLEDLEEYVNLVIPASNRVDYQEESNEYFEIVD